ncbi:hypothetical protein FISHEDRAFT_60390 [Fistulina hepatica ATCC 64428]|uniref:Uncharacterized protein n=1 Tax=Fistulina hepatica ATCC 64428 TaxID=1128425 RepID=A0A0D7A6J0_9AGAR|nr:hypothetical protein FISHEDRAFT_60390 [Fistulina hepatica ATCC 64428]
MDFYKTSGNVEPRRTGDDVSVDENIDEEQNVEIFYYIFQNEAENATYNDPFIVKFGGKAGASVDDAASTSEANIYYLFVSKLEWEFAHWAKLCGPSSTAATELLSIEGLSEKLNLSFKNIDQLNKIIDDQIPPERPKFECTTVHVGALYEDMSFVPYLQFAPEKHYSDSSKKQHMYHDMYTGKWWWSTQKKIDLKLLGGTIVPIILSLDKI